MNCVVDDVSGTYNRHIVLATFDIQYINLYLFFISTFIVKSNPNIPYKLVGEGISKDKKDVVLRMA